VFSHCLLSEEFFQAVLTCLDTLSSEFPTRLNFARSFRTTYQMFGLVGFPLYWEIFHYVIPSERQK